MTWNYRVIHRQHHIRKPSGSEVEHTYSIHEVYYDEDGGITSWSSDPIPAQGGDLNKLRWDLEAMERALSEPTLRYEELPGVLSEATE